MQALPQPDASLPSTAVSSAPEPCGTCKGAKWLLAKENPADPSPTAKMVTVRCPECNHPLLTCGLSEHEQCDFDALRMLPYDRAGYIEALTMLGKQIVARRFGFQLVYGPPGTAKSLWLRALVTQAAKSGVTAYYTSAVELEQQLFRSNEDDPRLPHLTTNVLAIDEAHSFNWRNDWIRARLQALLDYRHRMGTSPQPRQRLVTVLVANLSINEWGDSTALGAIASRLSDGTYSFVWPTGSTPPRCLTERPCPACGRTMAYNAGTHRNVCGCGFARPVELYSPFRVDLPDVRPALQAWKEEP